MRRGTKLYNLILPLWLLWMMPSLLWLFTLPANFIVDLTVSAVALRLSGAREIKKALKTSIVQTWLWGFAADFAGAAMMLAPELARSFCDGGPFRVWLDCLARDLTVNPAGSLSSMLWTLASIALSAFVIYRKNYNVCFRRAELTDKQRRCASLALAAVTAPWFFFLSAGAFDRL